MAFLEPQTCEYGLPELAARLYGGVAYTAERIQFRDTKRRFLPLHNLALAHRRPLLFPHAIAPPVPVAWMQPASIDTDVARLQRVRCDAFKKGEDYAQQQRHRNLIACELTVA